MAALCRLTVQEANAIWEVLVEYSGADASLFQRFAGTASTMGVNSWPVRGQLGRGGTLHLRGVRAPGQPALRVSCWKEDRSIMVDRVLGRTNLALASLPVIPTQV